MQIVDITDNRIKNVIKHVQQTPTFKTLFDKFVANTQGDTTIKLAFTTSSYTPKPGGLDLGFTRIDPNNPKVVQIILNTYYLNQTPLISHFAMAYTILHEMMHAVKFPEMIKHRVPPFTQQEIRVNEANFQNSGSGLYQAIQLYSADGLTFGAKYSVGWWNYVHHSSMANAQDINAIKEGMKEYIKKSTIANLGTLNRLEISGALTELDATLKWFMWIGLQETKAYKNLPKTDQDLIRKSGETLRKNTKILQDYPTN